ncbi:GspH/FimT family pseudopilin [Salinicola halophyticus]|uniref:GspH/FimT family pseudopilin n=1 Tax=Salinicola halophyticus TaxID=1808881 RepID=UPI003F44D642
MVSCSSASQTGTDRCASRRQRQRGFTLIELMICVVVMGILASWAAPGLANLNARMTLNSEVERVWQLLRRARQEAASSGQSTWLCPSQDGASCSDNGQWNRSLLLFIDSNGDKTLDDNERLIVVSQPSGSQVSVDPGSFSQGLGYTPLGFTRDRKAGTFILTNPALTKGGTKIVVHFARIRTEPVDDTDSDADDESET